MCFVSAEAVRLSIYAALGCARRKELRLLARSSEFAVNLQLDELPLAVLK